LFGRCRNIAIGKGDISCAVDENIPCVALSLGEGTDLRLIVEGEGVTRCLKGDIAASSDRSWVDGGGNGTTTSAGTINVNTEELFHGIYFLKIETEKGILTKKIVKE
jgi:hypothetical protein